MEDTGLGTERWVAQAASKPTWDSTTANVPAGPDWKAHSRDRFGASGVPKYRGVMYPGDEMIPFYAIPGIPWMWKDPDERIANTMVHLANYQWPNRWNQNQRITETKNYCEVRHNVVVDRDGFSVEKPLTWRTADDRRWTLFRNSHVGIEQENLSRRTGAVEFLINMRIPNDPLERFGPDALDPDTPPWNDPDEPSGLRPYEHTCEIKLGEDGGSNFWMTFGLHNQALFTHADRATTETIEMTPDGVPAHYVGGITGAHYCEDLVTHGAPTPYSESMAHMRDENGNIVKFQWNKWYRIRIEWTFGLQPDGTRDVRFRMYYGDPYELLRRAYFYTVTEAEYFFPKDMLDDEHVVFRRIVDKEYPLDDEWSAVVIIDRMRAALAEMGIEDDPVFKEGGIVDEMFEEAIHGDGTIRNFAILNGFGYSQPEGQVFHVGRIGASWDPGYIEYGTTTQFIQDPVPTSIEAVVDLDIHDEDVVIEMEYLPVQFDRYETMRTSLGSYDVKKHKISIVPKTFTLTIPAFTRRGKLFQGPADFGQFVSVNATGSGGSVMLYAVMGEGAKIFHGVKPHDAIETLYKIQQSMSSVPRLCPRCRGYDAECPVCKGKRYRKEDTEIAEFLLDQYLHYHDAPVNTETSITEKMGFSMALKATMNPTIEDVRKLFSRLMDVDQSSIRATLYGESQNVLVSISLPPGSGPNALLTDLGQLQWVADTIRPPGVEYIVAYSDSDFEDIVTFEDMWGRPW